MQSWIMDELETVDIGDQRLNKRFAKVLDRLSSKPNESIPAALSGGWAEIQAAYRFFDNDLVTPDKVLAPHRDAIARRCAGHAVVLLAQDTTELDLTRPKEKVGGPLGDEQHWGFFVHPSLALTPDRVPLGIWHAHMWARDINDYHKRLEARTKPIEEKESFRWLQGYQQACALQRQIAGQVVNLSDSEGDIYECFAAKADTSAGPTAEFIVRACRDRCLSPTDPAYEKDVTTLLWEAVEKAPVQGRRTIDVSARAAQTGDGSQRRQARSAREARVTLRATTVTLKGQTRPGRAAGQPRIKLPEVTVNVVLVREENPPAGEPAIEWLLVTSLPVTTLQDIENVVDYYCCRWLIEMYFKVVKSGCEVEKLQLETTDRLMACVAVYLIVAWRVLYLVHLGRECPEMKCDAVLTPDEWQSVWRVVKGTKPPKRPPTLGVMIKLIAQLGGYIPRKGEEPGAKTMWIGLQRTRDFALVWSICHPSTP
jgi:Transposase DNA-binding/Transposase Tn5 dimerisation domain